MCEALRLLHLDDPTELGAHRHTVHVLHRHAGAGIARGRDEEQEQQRKAEERRSRKRRDDGVQQIGDVRENPHTKRIGSNSRAACFRDSDGYARIRSIAGSYIGLSDATIG